MRFTKIAVCLLAAGMFGEFLNEGCAKAYAYSQNDEVGSKYYRMENTLIPFQFNVNAGEVNHDITITFVRTEIEGEFSSEPVVPGTYINQAFISFDGSAPVDLSEKFGVSFSDYLPEFKNTPADIRRRVDTVLQQVSGKEEGPYYSIENFRFFSSPDNQAELFQVDNKLYLRENGKEFQTDFDEKRLYSSSVKSDALIMDAAGVVTDKFPPFLTQWICEDKSLFTPAVSKERTVGASLPRKAMKQLLQGVCFEESPSGADVIGYRSLGESYMITYLVKSGLSDEDIRRLYSAIYDNNGRLLDTVYLGTMESDDFSGATDVYSSGNLISVRKGGGSYSNFRQEFEYLVLPDKFLLMRSLWKPDASNPSYFWNSCPWEFVSSIPASNTDYNMWEYVHRFEDGEYGEDAPYTIAKLTRRDPKSFEFWLHRHETTNLAKDILQPSGKMLFTDCWDGAGQEGEGIISYEFMPDETSNNKTNLHYSCLISDFSHNSCDEYKIFEGGKLYDKLAEFEQTVLGTFNGKDLERLTIFPQFGYDGEDNMYVEKYIIASENGTTPDLIIDRNWPAPITPDGEERYVASYEYDGYPRLKLNIDENDPARPQLIVNRYEGEGGSSEYTAWYNLTDGQWILTKAIYQGEEYNVQEESFDDATYELINGKWVKN